MKRKKEYSLTVKLGRLRKEVSEMEVLRITFNVTFIPPSDKTEYLLRLKALQDAVVDAAKALDKGSCVSFGQPRPTEP